MPGKINRRRQRRRILHTSDLHLEKLADKACNSLTAVVDCAINQRVDMVLIAGDLFDHNRIEGKMVDFIVGQLHRLTVSVVILPGNHDCLVPGSVYEKSVFHDDDNIYLLASPQGLTLDLPELRISVWGKCISSYDYDVLPLEGMPQPEQNGWWQVAVAHGYYVDGTTPVFPSYHISCEEVANSRWDYIALGHLPMFRGVCDKPLAYYCGSPTMSGSVALVTLDDEVGVRVDRCMLETK